MQVYKDNDGRIVESLEFVPDNDQFPPVDCFAPLPGDAKDLFEIGDRGRIVCRFADGGRLTTSAKVWTIEATPDDDWALTFTIGEIIEDTRTTCPDNVIKMR